VPFHYDKTTNESQFLATNFPKNFNWLGKYYDETFLALNCALQYGYLKNYGEYSRLSDTITLQFRLSDSTFSENFYGLQRVLDDGAPLSRHHRRISLLFAVLLPYFKRKLDEKASLYRLENADGCLRNVGW
jgi:hypothetical protein